MAVPTSTRTRWESEGASLEPHDARVLVVDDNPELLSILRDILHSDGYAVDCAVSSEEALQRITINTPSIIICDFTLSGCSGSALCDEIRLHPEWSHLPVIFLTSLGEPEEVRQALQWGCDGYLPKPFDPEDLVAMVRGRLHVSNHRLRMSKMQFEAYRKRIIHTLSHEFRTPLVSITTGTELLLDQQRELTNDQIRRLLESIQRGGYRLERLVNDFMMLQQIDLGHAANTCEKFRRRIVFADLVASAIESFVENLPKGQGGENIIFSSLSQDAAAGLVDVYDVQISSVVTHLLSNAVKFAGSMKPIEVSVSIRGNEMVLRIRDQGPGLQSQFFERATELFAQIDRETVEQQGAGVGLTIARAFTEINDGEIEFTPPGQGPGLVAELRFRRVQE